MTGSVAFSADGKTVSSAATTLLNGSTVAVVDLFNALTGEPTATVQTAATGGVNSITVSPANNLMAVNGWFAGSAQGETPVLELRDASTGSLIHTLDINSTDPIAAVAFSPDGSKLVAAGSFGSLFVFDAATGVLLRTYTGLYPLRDVAFAPDNKTVAIVSSTIELWDIDKGVQVANLTSAIGNVQALCFSLDGAQLAVQGYDLYSDGNRGYFTMPLLELWNVQSGTTTMTLSGSYGGVPSPSQITPLSYSPDGQYLFADVSGAIAISMANQSVQKAPNGSTTALSFNSEGDMIAMAWGEEGLAVAKNPLYGLVSLASVTLKSNSVSGGKSVNGTVTLAHPAPAVGAYITLATGSPNAGVPASIVIPAGRSSGTFTVKTSKGSSKNTVTITASVGAKSKSANLLIL
jgi:WD40 repeat protein